MSESDIPFWFSNSVDLAIPQCKINEVYYWKENGEWTCIIDNIKYSQKNGKYEKVENSEIEIKKNLE